MRSTEKMRCPRCGASMNHHADKIVRADGMNGTPLPDFEGVMVEFHSCPACGANASRIEH